MLPFDCCSIVLKANVVTIRILERAVEVDADVFKTHIMDISFVGIAVDVPDTLHMNFVPCRLGLSVTSMLEETLRLSPMTTLGLFSARPGTISLHNRECLCSGRQT